MREERIGPRRAAAVLAVLVVVSAGLRYWAAAGVATPWIAPDELLYALLGRSLWTHGSLNVLGLPTPYYSLVYPALAGLPLSLGSAHAGYTALKAVQAVVMSVTAVPVYLWGRSLMRRSWALAAAALALAIPGLAYSGLVMTEVAFYPLLVVAAWTAARALERPTPLRQVLLVGAVALAALTRLQALVLVPAVLSAAALLAVIERDRRRLARLWPLGVAAVGVAVWLAVRGSGALGGYAAATGSYGAGGAAKFVLYHAADLLLLCGVVPVCAVAYLLAGALAGRELSGAARAYLAVAASFAVWIVVEVGVFASEHAGKLEERDLLGLAPLAFLGLALWLDRGAPRTYVLAAAIAFVAAAVVLVLPFSRFFVDANVPDSFTVAAFQRRGGDATLLVGIPAVALAACFAVLPRRLLPVTVAVLAAGFAAMSVAASAQVRAEAANAKATIVGSDPTWIDRAARGPVSYLYAGGGYWNTVWEALFWNRRIARVFDVPHARVRGPMPQRTLLPAGDGSIAVPTPYLVSASKVHPVGRQAAAQQLPLTDEGTLTLWRLRKPPRLSLLASGLQPNGDVYRYAVFRAYACTSGSFVLTLLGKADATVDVRLDGERVQRVPVKAGLGRQVVVSVPPRKGSCALALLPSATVGVTQYRFARG